MRGLACVALVGFGLGLGSCVSTEAQQPVAVLCLRLCRSRRCRTRRPWIPGAWIVRWIRVWTFTSSAAVGG